jgi:phosphoribosylformylglycinamidine (FGAM) synthase PurS component
MLWEVEIQPKGRDLERDRVDEEYNLLTHTGKGAAGIARTARGYVLQGDLAHKDVERLMSELLVDSLAETGRLNQLAAQNGEREDDSHSVTVILKPGVMDATAMSVVDAAHDLGIAVDSVRTFRRYYFASPTSTLSTQDPVLAKVLANDAIEHMIEGPVSSQHLALGTPYQFCLVSVPLRNLEDAALRRLSRKGQLSLSLAEMRTIQAHLRDLEREPSDVELETLAQTW